MTRSILSLLLAFVGYSLHNIGQAGQKIGLAWVRRSWAAGVGIWIAASLGTSVAAFVLLYAVSMGSVALVGAIGGSGLASLALFSHWVLKEPIRRKEVGGVILVFLGSGLLGALSRPLPEVHPRPATLFIYLGVVCAAYLTLWIALRRGAVGIVIAGFAGALGGLIPLFQKISTSELARSRSLLELNFAAPGRFLELIQHGAEIFSNPYGLLWVGIAILSTLVMQFSYRHGEAIRLVPAFCSNALTVPVIGGMVCFRERLHPLQWLGVVLIVGGVLLLTLKGRSAAARSEPRRAAEGG